jgi:hypothetical protein
MSKKIHIDELFREGLNNGEEAMVPSAWSNMAKMLDGDNPYEKEQNKKRPFLWILGMGLLLMSAIAAGTKFLFPGEQIKQNEVSLIAPNGSANKPSNNAAPLAVAHNSQNNDAVASNSNISAEETDKIVQAKSQQEVTTDYNTVTDIKAINTNALANKDKAETNFRPNTNTKSSKIVSANTTVNNVAKKQRNIAANEAVNNNKTAQTLAQNNFDNTISDRNNTTTKSLQNNGDKKTIGNGTTAQNTLVNAVEINNATTITALPILSAQQFLFSINATTNAVFAKTYPRRNNLVMLPEATDVRDTFGYIVAINAPQNNASATQTQAANVDADKQRKAASANDSKDKTIARKGNKSNKKAKIAKPDIAASTENASFAGNTASSNSTNGGGNASSADAGGKINNAASTTATQNTNNQLLANRKKEVVKKAASPSAKEQMSEKMMNAIDKIKSRGFIDLGTGRIKVDPALFTGINSQFLNNKNDLGGFHMGVNCIIQIRRNLELMPHALFNYRTNGGYSIRDTVQTISDRTGPRFNGTNNEFAYTATTTAMTYNFKRTMSIEAPIALQWRPTRRVGVFAGVNLAYGFKFKTSNFYKTTTTAEVDIVPTTVNYAFPTDRISTYKDIDFKGRFGAGYLFGANWQATPNFFVDARVVQNIWDNSTTPSSKIISSNVFKVPAFQLSLGYRFKGLEQ